jgi:hypothetical protein
MLSAEWIGPALYAPELGDAVRLHLGAAPDAGVAVFNRGSAALLPP